MAHFIRLVFAYLQCYTNTSVRWRIRNMRNCIRQWLLYGDISDVVEFESQRTFLRKIEIYS